MILQGVKVSTLCLPGTDDHRWSFDDCTKAAAWAPHKAHGMHNALARVFSALCSPPCGFARSLSPFFLPPFDGFEHIHVAPIAPTTSIPHLDPDHKLGNPKDGAKAVQVVHISQLSAYGNLSSSRMLPMYLQPSVSQQTPLT